PIIAHAKALYAYTASDARDVGFERDDTIQVYEYMNADWWMGRNERTGAEGIFPRTYVETLPGPPPTGGYNDEKKGVYNAPTQPSYGGYPPPPQQQNPYNSSAPPMAVANGQPQAEGEGAGGKAGGMGKKFGKKLGNAAIFGAGATIGSNIVNSIF
ncbi:protein that induces appearance of [PIN+] prion when overproduced, partial [Gnomoniopsis sp. IMI 355080]